MADELLEELADAAQEIGLTPKTLRLWAAGKCIGGPDLTLGPETPLLCAALADYIEHKQK